jgi:hypothetical protein
VPLPFFIKSKEAKDRWRGKSATEI